MNRSVNSFWKTSKSFLLFSWIASCQTLFAGMYLDVSSLVWEAGGEQIYDPFDPQEYVQEQPFSVQLSYQVDEGASYRERLRAFVEFLSNLRNGGGKYFVTISSSNSFNNRELRSSYGSLPYQLYKDFSKTHILKDLDEALSSSETIQGQFKHFAWGGWFSGGLELRDEQKYYVSIPSKRFVQAGVYQDTYTFRLYSGNFDKSLSQSEDVKNVVFTTYVPSLAQISLVDSGSSFDEFDQKQSLDFGELIEGAEQGFDIRVRSNSPYVLSMESENKGFLLFEGYGAADDDKVSYNLVIDGVAQDLSAEKDVLLSSKISDSSGTQHQVFVSIGKVNYPRAGSYKDNIAVTCRTLE